MGSLQHAGNPPAPPFAAIAAGGSLLLPPSDGNFCSSSDSPTETNNNKNSDSEAMPEDGGDEEDLEEPTRSSTRSIDRFSVLCLIPSACSLVMAMPSLWLDHGDSSSSSSSITSTSCFELKHASKALAQQLRTSAIPIWCSLCTRAAMRRSCSEMASVACSRTGREFTRIQSECVGQWHPQKGSGTANRSTPMRRPPCS
jgi:hypothetical protein